MTREQIRLKLHRDGNTTTSPDLTYDIDMIQTVELTSTKDALSIAPPSLASSENILLGVSGMEADITINWQIHNDGTDKSNGSAGATNIETITDQIDFIENDVHAPDFSAAWELDHLTGSAFNDDDVFFEEFSADPISLNSPNWREARMRLRRGASIG